MDKKPIAQPEDLTHAGSETAPAWQPPSKASVRRQGGVSPQVEKALTDVRSKIYPRAVSGLYARWRVMMVLFTQAVFYGLPWLTWDDRQAVLFDLGARKFYIFGLVLWPQDVVYLAVLLVLSAFALFLFTAIAGRLFCGYACPQTVYTEIFMWVERKIEGDRLARIRLDGQRWSWRKLRLKVAKHFVWVVIAFWTGFTFIGYFAPIRALGNGVIAFSLGPWQWFWMLFYAFATWGNAGFMREAVCKYMCPYARFQSVMVDDDTFVVTYDYKRGEPRGGRSRKIDHKEAGMGDCVDCTLCVQVCPTGIDIRDGLQYMCIGCGACVDACDQVMEKVGYPKGLIRYTSGLAIKDDLTQLQARKRVLRPRVLFYTGLMALIAAGFAFSLFTRATLKMDIIRDRSSLGREIPGNLVENVYRLQFMNTDNASLSVNLRADGLPGLEMFAASGDPIGSIEVAGGSHRLVPVLVRLPARQVSPGVYGISFVATAELAAGQSTQVVEQTRFYVPQ
tara:strand:+ start:38276 stop:39793 length:1518 start_codon:yes stop_codon:yes gene_type:complete